MSAHSAQHSVARVQPVERVALSIEQAAESLGVSTRTVYELISGGQLRTLAIGRRRLVTVEELRRFARLPSLQSQSEVSPS